MPTFKAVVEVEPCSEGLKFHMLDKDLFKALELAQNWERHKERRRTHWIITLVLFLSIIINYVQDTPHGKSLLGLAVGLMLWLAFASIGTWAAGKRYHKFVGIE